MGSNTSCYYGFFKIPTGKMPTGLQDFGDRKLVCNICIIDEYLPRGFQKYYSIRIKSTACWCIFETENIYGQHSVLVFGFNVVD